MKILLCAIAKCENQYIKEWVNYYKALGIDKIVLYDNNAIDGENLNDSVGEDIISGYIDLQSVRGLRGPIQLPLYTQCYNVNKGEYDWFLFFDIDEFLVLPNADLKMFLANDIFSNYNMIHVNWMCYGDCGLVYNDKRPCLERFNKPLPFDSKTTYNFPDNFHVKSIIRGKLPFCKFTSPHTAIVPGICCNMSGNQCEMHSPFAPYDFTNGYLKHFTTKTAEEYAAKMHRGFCDRNWTGSQKELNFMINLFFKRNERTEEKYLLIKKAFDK